MSSRPALHLAFAVAVLAPMAFGCDMLKKDDADAAADAAAAAVAPAATPVAPGAAPADTATAPAAPLGGTTVTPGAKPGAVAPAKPADGGAAVADAGVLADGGKAAPAPTPTFQIPTAIPGFDAGGFKPPPGFPTAIPSTFPTIPPPPPPAPAK